MAMPAPPRTTVARSDSFLPDASFRMRDSGSTTHRLKTSVTTVSRRSPVDCARPRPNPEANKEGSKIPCALINAGNSIQMRKYLNPQSSRRSPVAGRTLERRGRRRRANVRSTMTQRTTSSDLSRVPKPVSRCSMAAERAGFSTLTAPTWRSSMPYMGAVTQRPSLRPVFRSVKSNSTVVPSCALN